MQGLFSSCGSDADTSPHVSEEIPWDPKQLGDTPVRSSQLENRLHHLENRKAMKVAPVGTNPSGTNQKSFVQKKPTVSFSPSAKADHYSSSLEFEQQEDKNPDHWETGSNSTSATEMDDTKKQLEELQIKTIFSLVEPLEVEIDSKTMHKKLLFIT
jgi:hypothetical protein